MRGQVGVAVRARIGDGIGTSAWANRTSPTPGTDEPKPLPGSGGLFEHGTGRRRLRGGRVVLGLWADSAWHTAPILLVVGLVLGLAAAAASVVAQIRKYL